MPLCDSTLLALIAEQVLVIVSTLLCFGAVKAAANWLGVQVGRLFAQLANRGREELAN